MPKIFIRHTKPQLVLFGMAMAGELPKIMTKAIAQKLPQVTTLVIMAAMALFLLMGDIKIVAGMLSLGALLVFVVINNAHIVLRFKAPGQKRPFSVLLSIRKVPVLPVLAILISLVPIVQYEWQTNASFAGALAVGLVLDYFLDKRQKEK